MIRLSFVFVRASEEEKPRLTVNDILADAQADAIELLRADEPEAFQEAVQRFLELYETLLDASMVKDVSGADTTLALVGSREHWMGEPLYLTWSRRLRDLFAAASSRISQSEDYARFLAHVPNRLYSKAQEQQIPGLMRHFIELSPVLLRQIESWWTTTLEQQGDIRHGPCAAAVLRPPFSAAHDKVLREFIGAWETLKNERIPRAHEGNEDWNALRQSATDLTTHLTHTVSLLFDCLARGDRNATEWVADVLVKWYAGLGVIFDDARSEFLRAPQLLTIDLLDGSWSEVEGRIEWDNLPTEGRSLALVEVCVRNLWIDVCCLVVSACAQWSRRCGDCDRSLPAEIFAAVAKGQALRGGGPGYGRRVPCDDAEDLLLAILRQNHGGQEDGRSYSTRLDEIVAMITEPPASEMVPGRMYSGLGSGGMDALADGQLLTLLALTPKRWKPTDAVAPVLRAWAVDHNAALRQFKEFLGSLETQLHDATVQANLSDPFECLRKKLGGELPFTEARTNLIAKIQRLRQIADEAHGEALAVATPSPQRLLQIAAWASSAGFSKKTGAFPLPLFRHVADTPEPLESRAVTIQNVKKGELTDPPLANRVAREDEWYRETVRGWVANEVMRDVLIQLKPETAEAHTPQLWWSEFLTYSAWARQQHLRPLLLVSNATSPPWAWEWAHPSHTNEAIPTPPDLRVTRNRDPKATGYRWSFNGVPVFVAPILAGASMLLVRQSFEKVTFTRLENDLRVSVTTREVAGRTDVVDLELAWRMHTTVAIHAAVQLQH